MKTVVVSTDFLPAADAAMHYAAQLAQAIQANLMLLHVYQIPVTMNDETVLLIAPEELRTGAEAGMSNATTQLQKNFPGLRIQGETRLGNVTDEVDTFCKELQPLVLVTGNRSATGIDRLLFGSTTLELVRRLQVPVISVPENTSRFGLQNMLLAIDDEGVGEQAAFIKEFVALCNARLHVVHIRKSDEEKLGSVVPELGAAITTLTAGGLTEGISQYLQQNPADLLMVLPHKHHFLERLFATPHTTALLQHIEIPLMCIPGKRDA